MTPDEAFEAWWKARQGGEGGWVQAKLAWAARQPEIDELRAENDALMEGVISRRLQALTTERDRLRAKAETVQRELDLLREAARREVKQLRAELAAAREAAFEEAATACTEDTVQHNAGHCHEADAETIRALKPAQGEQ